MFIVQEVTGCFPWLRNLEGLIDVVWKKSLGASLGFATFTDSLVICRWLQHVYREASIGSGSQLVRCLVGVRVSLGHTMYSV